MILKFGLDYCPMQYHISFRFSYIDSCYKKPTREQYYSFVVAKVNVISCFSVKIVVTEGILVNSFKCLWIFCSELIPNIR